MKVAIWKVQFFGPLDLLKRDWIDFPDDLGDQGIKKGRGHISVSISKVRDDEREGDVWFFVALLTGAPPRPYNREPGDDARGHQMAERQRCGGPRGKQERLVAPSKVKIRH